MKKTTFLALSIFLILALCGTTAAAEMPDNNYVNLEVVNDNGARIDTYGNDSYDFFNGNDGSTSGLNSLKINDDGSTNTEVVNTTSQSGTFYIFSTGGQGRVDDGILMLAVNGTVPDDFQVHITASGYTWAYAPGFVPTQADLTYNAVTLDETFGKTDFIYGPQIWKPVYQINYPIFDKQDMTNTSNTFSVMLIDLYSGILVGGNYNSLIDNGAIKIQYSFQNLPLGSLASFNAYGFSTTPETGSTAGSVQWTNRVNSAVASLAGSSGYNVFGTAVNTAPVAADDSATTNENSPVTITVLSNDSDVDGDSLTVTGVSDPANGSVVINLGGTVTYTPDTDYVGVDTFTYTISDGKGGSDTATVTVTVNEVTGANNPPVAVDNTVSTPEDTTSGYDVLANDSDPDGDSLTITGVTQPSHGQATFTTTYVTYTPNSNYVGVDSFTYTISDGQGGSDTATVTVTVTPVNDPPVAVDDTASANEDTPVTITVLANDSDVDGDTLSVTGVSDPAHGSAVINPAGTVTYTPDTGFSGPDSFTYTISDGNQGTDTATVMVYITSIPVADLNLTKTVDNAAPTVKDTVIFTLIVNNNGPDTAVDVTVFDKLPAGLTYVSYTANYGTYDPNAGLWTIPALPNGESAFLTITSVVEESGQILNQANVTAFSWDPNLEGNAASAAMDVQAQSETDPVPVEAKTIAMEKTGAPIFGVLLAFFMVLVGMVLPKRK